MELVSEKEPAWQREQVSVALCSAKLPAGQAVQEEELELGEKEPGAQGEQSAVPLEGA